MGDQVEEPDPVLPEDTVRIGMGRVSSRGLPLGLTSFDDSWALWPRAQ